MPPRQKVNKQKEKELIITYIDTIQPTEVSWTAFPYIPQGKISLLTGDPGLGKTTLAIDIAARLSTGRAILESNREALIGNTLYLSAEDNVSDTLKPRFMSAKADCSKIAIIQKPDSIDISADCQLLERAVKETNAKFVVIDPLTAYLGRDTDMCRASDMRRLMGGLAHIAEKYACAVLTINHLTKATGSKSLYRGLGSIDIAASARSVMMIERSVDDPKTRILHHIKSSLSVEGQPLEFQIESDSSISVLGVYENKDDDMYGDMPTEDNKRELASNIMLGLLSGVPRPCTIIQQACYNAGVSESTINRAKKDLGIQSVRKSDGWYWSL